MPKLARCLRGSYRCSIHLTTIRRFLNLQLRPAAPAHGAGGLARSCRWSEVAAAAATARVRQAGGVARPALPARVAARRAGGAPGSSSGAAQACHV